MATVLMNAAFLPGTKVELIPRLATALHVAGSSVAEGTVDEDSVLRIEDVDASAYWAVPVGEERPPVMVRAKDIQKREAPEAETVRESKPLASAALGHEDPRSARVHGARTTGNARAATARPKEALTAPDPGAPTPASDAEGVKRGAEPAKDADRRTDAPTTSRDAAWTQAWTEPAEDAEGRANGSEDDDEPLLETPASPGQRIRDEDGETREFNLGLNPQPASNLTPPQPEALTPENSDDDAEEKDA